MRSARQSLRDANIRGIDVLPDMDEFQFRQWVDLLEERTGTVIPPARKSFLVTNLGLRMKEIGCESYQKYFERLNSGISGLKEWSILVDRITVHETRFFRHPSSLDLVREKVLSKLPEENGKVNIQAWSVACATGEEAYTLAIVIDQALASRFSSSPSFDHLSSAAHNSLPGYLSSSLSSSLSSKDESYFGITATDISQASLLTGREGIYNSRRIDNIDQLHAQQYFEHLDNGRYKVCDRLRKRVCFARMNILDIGHEPIGKMDIIYCQNLLIYFEREMREELVSNMVKHLNPGGLLILGSGELLGWKHPFMDKINCSHTLAYQRCFEINSFDGNSNESNHDEK